MATLPLSFFARPTLRVARDLVGSILTAGVNGVSVSGRIVEVEAYLGRDDPERPDQPRDGDADSYYIRNRHCLRHRSRSGHLARRDTIGVAGCCRQLKACYGTNRG